MLHIVSNILNDEIMFKSICRLGIWGFLLLNGVSCSHNEIKIVEPDKNNLSIVNCQADSGLVRIVAHPTTIKNRQIIGAGLDIMGGYLDISSIKAPIVDLNKYDFDYNYTCFKDIMSFSEMFIGPNALGILDMLKGDFNIEVPDENFNDKLFTGTITNKFNDEYDYSSQFSFFIGNAYYRKYSHHIMDVLPERFNDEFKNDLNTLTADQIISKYGTHVMKAAHVGCVIMSSYRSLIGNMPLIENTYNEANRTIIDAFSNYQSKAHFNWHPDYVDSTYNIQSYGSSMLFEFMGGDHTKAPKDYCSQSSGCKHKNDDLLADWYGSVADDNLSSVFMSESAGDYIPIYRIVEYDKELSKRIKEATVRHIKSKQITIMKTMPLFQVFEDNAYRYSTQYSSDNNGVIASLYADAQPNTEPLYRYSNESGDRLSFDPEIKGGNMTQKEIIGYCYNNIPDGGITVDTLTEISNGKQYIYILNDKKCEYKGWNSTGVKIYTRKINGL